MKTDINTPLSGYDSFAWFYRKHWCAHYHPWAIAVLEKLIFPRLVRGSRVLDLCCGVGTISRALVDGGFRVTGVDSSEQMLRYARQSVPGDFIRADVREFRMPPLSFDAAVCTFDSLNHILTPEELLAVFRNVSVSLMPGGPFAFDVNLEEGYRTQWSNTCTVVEADNAFFVRGRYDPEKRLGRTDITMFRLDQQWRRSDTTLLQRCYSEGEIRQLLRDAGFSQAESYDVPRDLGIEGRPGVGRAFFLAVR